MLITTKQIDAWASTKEAQAALPRLVRRLVYSTGLAKQGSFPAGDSTSLPGWDGELLTDEGNAWVPAGRSFWEFSCETKATNKANRDYAKRTKEALAEIRRTATFIVVTARKWPKKSQWLKNKLGEGEWREVRAYDADDLEQWLEQSPAVAQQFADELGLMGPGVESVSHFWQGWANQSDPTVSDEALFAGRQEFHNQFVDGIRRRLNSDQPETYTLRADSVDEAAAFAAAAILGQPDLNAMSLVVTDSNGWRFVQQNPTLRVVIAGRPEYAAVPVRRAGLLVIIPYGAGDMAGHYQGVAGRDQSVGLALERPSITDFKSALASLGVVDGDAARLAQTTGRSWAVFRRRRATNPALRRPAWLETPQASSLSTICLLGVWSASSDGDRDIVQFLAGRAYEEVERDLQHLALHDDAPVLRIGEVWKAKSPLELLELFGERITRSELNRFFEIAQQVLLASDPVLDLPEDQRFAAQIYGKVRPQSGLLIRSLCDTLVKLVVRSPQLMALANIDGRIASFVFDLLHNANETRWLSLSNFLPSLAEAAPDAFLRSVEYSLMKPGAPVTRLFTDTTAMRCWHSGLLWALESLAWAPARLTRVSLLLARLVPVKIQGNWGNTPLGSLMDIFRSWVPQTAAGLGQRIATLDTLVDKEPDVAFDLLDRLVNVGPDHATPNARPNWRDDDSGAGHGATAIDQHGMLVAAADRMIACAAGHPGRIARLIAKIRIFDSPRKRATLTLIEPYTDLLANDEDRETIRAALRKVIHWERNYEKTKGRALDMKLRAIERLYERLLPRDLLVRHRWLFTDGWTDLPVRTRDDYGKGRELLAEWRTDALREILSESGMAGIERLAVSGANASNVGMALATLDLDTVDLAGWIVNRVEHDELSPTIRGLLRWSPNPQSTELVKAVLVSGEQQGWDARRIVDLLVLARSERETWDVAASYGVQVEKAYWEHVTPDFWLSDDQADLEFAIRRLLEAGRPRAAFQVCSLGVERVDALLLADMLEGMTVEQDEAGPAPDSWRIGEAVDRLEASEAIDRERLVLLEFRLFPALEFAGEEKAKTLYHAIMSDPQLFTQLLCILYKPTNTEGGEPLTQGHARAAEVVWEVFHHCRRLPGLQPDGTIDGDAFTRFVSEARELCQRADLLEVCDVTLGNILAHAPADSGGVWPCAPVRDLLDRPELEDIRDGFTTGVFNKRGVTSRAYDAGGGLERELANKYHESARMLHSTHVNVAAVLDSIANGYEKDGSREDVEASLRREGY